MGKCFSSNVVKLYISFNGITNLALGTTYNRYPSQGHYDCPNAISSDTCIFHCTGNSASKKFYCGNAGDCQFECDAQKCADQATIYGNSASTLNINVLSGGAQCMNKAIIYAPDSGSLYLNRMDDIKAYESVTIHASSTGGTKNIIIDCTQDASDGKACKAMQVNAASAQYLEIISGSGSWFKGDVKDEKKGDITYANVYCPVDSDYIGPQIAPCIFDMSGGGSIQYAQIYTAYGIPSDVWIREGSSTSISNSKLYCNAGNTADFMSKTSNCWNTNAPTTDPTDAPTTRNPTISPTTIPSVSPTQKPSKTPSGSPTTNPSINPSEYPTATPTGTAAPTKIPSQTPSQTPSESPSKTPSIPPSQTRATNDDDNESDDGGNDGGEITESGGEVEGPSMMILISIAVVAVLFCLVVVAIICFMRKVRKTNAERVRAEQIMGQSTDNVIEVGGKGGKKGKAARKLAVEKFFIEEVELPGYSTIFIDNGYDSMKAILGIQNRSELEAIGISLYGHQSQILTAVRKLIILLQNKDDEDGKEGMDGETTSNNNQTMFNTNAMVISDGVAQTGWAAYPGAGAGAGYPAAAHMNAPMMQMQMQNMNHMNMNMAQIQQMQMQTHALQNANMRNIQQFNMNNAQAMPWQQQGSGHQSNLTNLCMAALPPRPSLQDIVLNNQQAQEDSSGVGTLESDDLFGANDDPPPHYNTRQ